MLKFARVRRPQLSKYFEHSQRVFQYTQLLDVVAQNRDEWALPSSASIKAILDFLLESTKLQKVTLKGEVSRDKVRYVWGDPSPYSVLLSLGRGSYLSHATAVYLHGLTDQVPKTIYVNSEQSPKRGGTGALSQDRISRAFAGHQRKSRNYFAYQNHRALLLSGKNTGRLEVGKFTSPDGASVDVTKLERTLIDVVVRPDYAGGPLHVQEAFSAALERISTNVLTATLKKLEYVYPYHQVIGFYMKRAGAGARQLDLLKALGLEFDFYLTYGMREPDYDEEWRLYVPKGL